MCVISTTGTPYIYVQKRQKTQPIIDYFEANKEELNQLLLSSTRSIIGSVHDGSPYYCLLYTSYRVPCHQKII